jgi:hypothetical protein
MGCGGNLGYINYLSIEALELAIQVLSLKMTSFAEKVVDKYTRTITYDRRAIPCHHYLFTYAVIVENHLKIILSQLLEKRRQLRFFFTF